MISPEDLRTELNHIDTDLPLTSDAAVAGAHRSLQRRRVGQAVAATLAVVGVASAALWLRPGIDRPLPAVSPTAVTATATPPMTATPTPSATSTTPPASTQAPSGPPTTPALTEGSCAAAVLAKVTLNGKPGLRARRPL